MLNMNELADADDVLAQIRQMPLEERHRITAALLKDLSDDFDGGEMSEPPEAIEELRRRAEEALAHPVMAMSLAEFRARASASFRAHKT